MKTRRIFHPLFLLALLVVAGGKMYGQQIVYEPYDFRQVNADGDTLYYRITSDTEPYTVAVTRCHDSTYHRLPIPQYAYQVGQPGYAYPIYDYDSLIIVPATVTHEGTTYTITSVDREAFYFQRNLRVVYLPSTITIIGDDAFYQSSLTEISLPNNLQSIEHGAFSCTPLNGISFPQTLSNIGSLAFAVTNISKVDLPSGVGILRNMTFYRCPIEEITFSEGLVVIEDKAFSAELIDTLIFPSTLQYLGSLQGEPISPQYFTENNCRYIEFRNGTEPLALGNYCLQGCSHLETLILSDNIVSLGEESFSYCNIDTMFIPQNVRVIPSYCFAACDSLKSVILPEHLDTIYSGAFSHCPLLKSIVLPAELKYIGSRAFISYNDTSGIEEVEVLAEEPPFLQGIADGPFPKTWPITCTIPCGTLSAYQISRWGTVYTNMSFIEDCDAVEEYADSEIRVYPNPASDVIYIEGDIDNETPVFIYDMAGKIVTTTNLTPLKKSINVSYLPQGFYILKIEGNEGGGYGIKVSKQ